MDQTSLNHYKGAIEALLFVNEKPVTVEQLKEAMSELDRHDIRSLLLSLQEEYQQRNAGILLVEIAGGFQFLTNSSYVQYIRNFYKTKQKEKLSKPALETLAIVAYRQPITRLDVELVRGVNSDGVMAHLLDKELIKVVGRKDVPGKPYLYGTTKQFLEYFGLKSLDDLPNLEDFPKLHAQVTGEGEAKEISQEVSNQTQPAVSSEDGNALSAEVLKEQGIAGQDNNISAETAGGAPSAVLRESNNEPIQSS